MRRVSSLQGLTVIATSQGVNLGTVDEVVVDLAEGTVEGLIIRSGSIEKCIRAEDVDVLGTDAIMVEETADAKPLSEAPDLADRRTGKEERRLSVMTSSGKKLGQVGEIYIDPENLSITRFEISGGSLRDLTDGTLSFPVVKGMIHGRDVLLVPDNVIASIPTGEGGLRGAWAKVSEQLKDEYESVSERAEVLYKESAENVKRAMEQARDKSREVSQQVSERIEDAKEKTAAKAGDLEQEQAEAGPSPEAEMAGADEAREDDVPTPEPPPEPAEADEAGSSDESGTAEEVQQLEEQQVEADPNPDAEVVAADGPDEESEDEESDEQ